METHTASAFIIAMQTSIITAKKYKKFMPAIEYFKRLVSWSNIQLF